MINKRNMDEKWLDAYNYFNNMNQKRMTLYDLYKNKERILITL